MYRQNKLSIYEYKLAEVLLKKAAPFRKQLLIKRYVMSYYFTNTTSLIIVNDPALKRTMYTPDSKSLAERTTS